MGWTLHADAGPIVWLVAVVGTRYAWAIARPCEARLADARGGATRLRRRVVGARKALAGSDAALVRFRGARFADVAV